MEKTDRILLLIALFSAVISIISAVLALWFPKMVVVAAGGLIPFCLSLCILCYRQIMENW